MDQGGELYNNPEVKSLFKKYTYEIFPIGADSSPQNGPFEQIQYLTETSLVSLALAILYPIGRLLFSHPPYLEDFASK